jgi:AraC family transcriptional regulator
MNAALDFIDGNLGNDITLARLAAAANFSPFHFHRIFSALLGEPPAEYIRRLRLEKAAVLLVTDPSASVTSIALGCGFSTSALFCRLFKARFGMPPTVWRENRKIGQPLSKERKDTRPGRASYWREQSGIRARRWGMKKTPVVRMENVPAFRVAYVKHMKGYKDAEGIGTAFQTLFAWAGPRGVMSPDMRVLGMPLDNPEITPEDKCRYYACLAVDERAQPEGEVGVMNVRPGMYAVGRFSGGSDVFRAAYAYMYGEWLPGSGCQPDDAPAFESYVGQPGGTAARPRFVFDLYVPVKPI